MAGDSERFQEAMSTGIQFAWDNKWRQAIGQFNVARDEFPDDPVPHARLGQAHYELAQYRESLGHYQQAVRLNPADVAGLGWIADILERLGQLSSAARTYIAVAEAHLQARNVEQAIANWERATRLDPDLISARQRLALVYQRIGRLRDSVREHLALARIYQASGNIPQAAAVCKAALQMDPSNADILAAVSLLRRGVIMEAPPAEPVAPPEPEAALAPPGLSDALHRAALHGAVKSAAFAFESDEVLGWQEEPDTDSETSGSPVDEARQAALANLAGIVFEEDTAEAGALLAKADRDALISQAIEHQTRGDIDQAIDAYERAIQGGIQEAAAHFNLGLLYQERLRLDEAIERFQQSLDGTSPEYRLGSHFALGECFRAKGKIDEALSHFLEVAKIVDMRTVKRDQVDDLVRLYESLADTFALRGEQEQATRFATALVEFLGTKGWEDKVKDARSRLDSLTEEGPMMSLAELLAVPGSDQLLESISLTNEFARRGWLDTAVEECYSAVQQAPFFMPAHLLLARLQEQRGQIEAAGDKYVTVAQVYRTRGDVTQSMEAFEHAMRLAPLDMALRTRLIEMLKRHGEIDRALEHSVALAEAYYQLAQIDKAREKYQEALRLAPRGAPERQWSHQILHRVADIDLQRLNWRDAVAAYSQIVRISPDDERASVTLVELLFKMGRPHEALGQLDRYLSGLASHGRSRKILAILNDLIAQQSDDFGLLNRLAAAYAQAGDTEKAIENLDRLGELQLDAGLREDAARTIRSILALGPADAGSYKRLLEQISEIS